MTKRPKNLDLNQLAKRLVDLATGEEEEKAPEPTIKDSGAEKNEKTKDKKINKN